MNITHFRKHKQRQTKGKCPVQTVCLSCTEPCLCSWAETFSRPGEYEQKPISMRCIIRSVQVEVASQLLAPMWETVGPENETQTQ